MIFNSDILSKIKSFLTEDYIYFAPVSHQWNAVWGDSPRKTRRITEFTTVSQIWQIVEMNSLKNKWFQSLLDVFLLVVNSNLAYVNGKVKSKRCFICNKKFDEF